MSHEGGETLAAHLERAEALLRADRLEEAEREVAAALVLGPNDVGARNVSGLIHFRAGRYAEAERIYHALCAESADDPALRLNLGLVELRAGQHREAAANLRRVVAVEPDNRRAQGYLGQALFHAGELAEARLAFERAGQPERVHQVDLELAKANDGGARLDLRRAAGDGEHALEAEQPFSPAELEAEPASAGAWQLRTPGQHVPLPGPEGPQLVERVAPLALRPAVPVAVFATERLLRPGAAGEPFALAEGGMLVVRVDGELATRTFGAIATSGPLRFEPLMRRRRGQATSEPFGGGDEAMRRVVGHGLIVVAPRGGRFTALALADDIFYVRESALFAFDPGLGWESGHVPGSDHRPSTGMVQFRGSGRLVLRAARPAFCLKIEPEAPLSVEATALLGWVGRVVPRLLVGKEGQPTAYLECTGEGVLLLEEPAE